MNELSPRAIRWEPAIAIPDSPCADFVLKSYEDGVLKLTLRYSWVNENNFDLVLTFSEVRAFRTFWDGDGDDRIIDLNPPRCSGRHSGFIWPLLEIEQSRWLSSGNFATSIFIAEGTRQLPWHHYRLITLERSVDVLARGAIAGEWVASVTPGK